MKIPKFPTDVLFTLYIRLRKCQFSPTTNILLIAAAIIIGNIDRLGILRGAKATFHSQ